ncbi:hypothetical protein UFOVP733_24 [uncultured Caudovirales phage]|uniref:Uncharacterized protein n=1 Tax=uncultured Caudovirales phage TaxID=2100421 RepID=A0A6J7X2J7_9CAUD|nr:hypothetical protein UFOVP733_24 [uncultured Caudovirales phage]CAB5224916.1 hypothetical protein UFOVP743_35 [uncultured Caudovirales phage]
MIAYDEQCDWMSIKQEMESQTVIFKYPKHPPSTPEKLSTKSVYNSVNNMGDNSHVI